MIYLVYVLCSCLLLKAIYDVSFGSAKQSALSGALTVLSLFIAFY